MLQFLCDHLIVILIGGLIICVAVFFYFLLSAASRFEKTREKRQLIMQRAQKLKEKLELAESYQ